MIAKYFKVRGARHAIEATPAAPYLGTFALDLERAGYRPETIRVDLQVAAHATSWAGSKGILITDMDESLVGRFEAHVSRCRARHRSPAGAPRPTDRGRARGRGQGGCHWALRRRHAYAGWALRLFLEHLRRQGVIRRPPPPREPAALVAFRDWLRRHRGLSEKTVHIYTYFLRHAFAALGADARRFRAERLRAYVLARARESGRSSAMMAVQALRIFLRFEVARGRCRPGLEAALPRFASWRLSSVPRHVSAGEVERIVGSCAPSLPGGYRDRAILLLLARLALRAGDVAALRLQDIDWKEATLFLSGKSRRACRLPLPQEVGDAILDYLRHGRPALPEQHVFITAQPPFEALTTVAVSLLVKRAIRRAGVDAPTMGAHLLRHSAATTWLRQGASLEGIRVVLRHQSPATTTLYAKVDFRSLQEITLPWSEVVPCS